MASKSSDWQPGPNVCRCCLAEGCYKDISTEYFWMGKREVYAEMLTETLDLEIAFSGNKGPNGNSRLICESCISRLRDATEFKRQVQECEKTFMQHLDIEKDPDEIDADTEQKDVKIEYVKEERLLSDDDDDDDNYAPPDQPDDDDDWDDEPLTNLAKKVPKKEKTELQKLLMEEYLDEDILAEDKPVVVLKRKSNAKTKPLEAKKVKIVKKTSDTASASKAKPEKKKKADIETRRNAELVLRYTTAYPFRVRDKWILCVYCHDEFDDPNAFRQHMDNEHDAFRGKVVFYNLPIREFVKADLTDLKCKVCSEPLDNLDTAAQHLKEKHNYEYVADEKIGVMPYRLRKDLYNCAVCDKSVPSLLHLNRHTITHFLSYVCHICGSSYVATTGLLRHVRSKHQQYQARCRTCWKTFPTIEAKERHRRTVKSCGPYCCPSCNDRFLDFKSRRKHMETVHGESSKRELKCGDCNITFSSENAYYVHFKLHHSQDYVVCNRCGMKFVSNSKLKRHLATHDCA